MSWVAVAEKDFRDAIRSRLMLIVAGLFVLFLAGGAAIGTALGLGGGDAVGLIMFFMLSGTSVFVPIIAIGLAYRSIAGERDTGSLKILLSLPNSRADVVLGKFVGRSAVLAVAVFVGYAAGLVAFVAAFDGGIQFDTYVSFMATTLLLGFVFVSLTVGISAFTTSTFQAAVGAIGVFVVFEWLWGLLAQVLWYVANDFEQPGLGAEPPDWLEFLFILNPSVSYDQATQWLFDTLSNAEEAQQASALEPFGLEPWFGFVILAWWIALPLAIGYLRFEATDL